MYLSSFSYLRVIINSLYIKKSFKSLISKRYLCGKFVDVNTNVVKDVILYKYSNDRYFKIANIFGISQFGIWTYLSIFSYGSLRDAPVLKTEEDTVWWRKINLGENKYRYGLTFLSFCIGFGILGICWMLTIRSVKYLILRKGGKQVTVVTHTPFGTNRMITLGLENINCKQLRSEAKTQLPIKIKGHFMHFILDMKGEFQNPQLFDSTCGLARTFK